MYQSTSFHTVPPPGAQNSVPREAPRDALPEDPMSIRLRLVLLLLALLVFVLAASSWLLLRAYQSEHAAQEQAARVSSMAVARLLDKEPRTAGADQVLAALRPLLDSGWPGFLVDSTGRALPAGPGAAADLPALPADFSERLAASLAQAAPGVKSAGQGAEQSAGGDAGQDASQGWLDLPDAQGGPLRAFFSKSAQGWTWVSWVPCSALDPACSRPLKGVIWVAIGLFAVAGLGLARLALRGSAALVLPAMGGKAQDHGQGQGGDDAGLSEGAAVDTAGLEAAAARLQSERLQVVGRLAGRFSHEFNNQLGILSNSAYLIERRSEDPGLRLPAQAMLRSVDTASRLTQQLLRFGAHHCTHALVVDLYRWLPGLQGTLAVVLGKRMALEVAEPAEASQPGQPAPRLGVHVDPDELELALISIFLAIREAMTDGAQVHMAARPLSEDLAQAQAAASRGDALVEIRIEALAHGAGAASTGSGTGEAGAPRLERVERQDPPPVFTPLNDADADATCGLSLARRLCLERGGVVRAEGEHGRCLAVSLVLPRVAMAAQDCLAQRLD
ncbi:Signal transduction histidine kinase [Delftia acidovorans]|nr:Signal transduction histidine kinase [Delftia acidovorans]